MIVHRGNRQAALLRWKREALSVLAEWEDVWEAAGRPGRLGASKAAAVKAEIEQLRADKVIADRVRDLCGIGDACWSAREDREVATTAHDLLLHLLDLGEPS